LWQRLTKNNTLNFILTSYLGFNAERAHEKDVNSYIDGVNQIPFSVFHSLIDDYTRFDGKTYLSQFDSPALVIAGDKDVITPKSVQDEMVAAMPKAEMQVIPEGSHNAHTDFPDEVNLLMDAFLQKIGYQ
jgi:pimeloyl-ACP methyl ester carboxylesterase